MPGPVPLSRAWARLILAHPLLLAAGVVTGVALQRTVMEPMDPDTAMVALAFGALIFIGEVVRVALPGGREASPLASAGALGFALVTTVGTMTVTHSPWLTIALTAVASVVGATVHAAVGREPRLDTVARRILVVGLAAELFQRCEQWLPSDVAPVTAVVAMAAVVAVAGLAEFALAAFDRRWRLRTPFLAAFGSEVRLMLGLGAAVGATGVLIPLAMQRMGLWALPALSVPLLVTQASFRRYAGIRATHEQTIRALSRLTEVGGYVADGHAARVTALAVATGGALGMTEEELVDLEYAALLHDVGQLSLDEPIPRGSTLAVAQQDRRRIAGLGADIVRGSGFVDAVATLVEQQAEPYRRNRRASDDGVPLGSRIIKAVSAYDDLAMDGGDDVRARSDALERLRLGMAYEYDPRVVAALADVVMGRRA